jgi:hypothetical protein
VPAHDAEAILQGGVEGVGVETLVEAARDGMNLAAGDVDDYAGDPGGLVGGEERGGGAGGVKLPPALATRMPTGPRRPRSGDAPTRAGRYR